MSSVAAAASGASVGAGTEAAAAARFVSAGASAFAVGAPALVIASRRRASKENRLMLRHFIIGELRERRSIELCLRVASPDCLRIVGKRFCRSMTVTRNRYDHNYSVYAVGSLDISS